MKAAGPFLLRKRRLTRGGGNDSGNSDDNASDSKQHLQPLAVFYWDRIATAGVIWKRCLFIILSISVIHVVWTFGSKPDHDIERANVSDLPPNIIKTTNAATVTHNKDEYKCALTIRQNRRVLTSKVGNLATLVLFQVILLVFPCFSTSLCRCKDSYML